MKKNLTSRASALLISFFLMSILILVGLGVSTIVFSDLASVRTILNGKMSAYAAEGMSELGLGIVNEHLPGYEVNLEEELTSGAIGNLEIVARGDALPCIVSTGDEEYRTLVLNESIQIPLFADGGDDTQSEIEDITQFKVSYEMLDNPVPQGNILRWKILGLNPNSNPANKTEAISDYIEAGESADNFFDQSTEAKYYGLEDTHYAISDLQIGIFLDSHKYNYLVLTNAVQLSGIENLAEYQDVTDADLNNINFQMTDTDQDAVCEYVTLNSSSDYSDTQNGVITKVKEGENLPVFDFALYNAKGKSVLPVVTANTPNLP